MATPEVKVVVDRKGREFTGPEQPLGVGPGICMQGRKGRAPWSFHTAHSHLLARPQGLAPNLNKERVSRARGALF